MKLFEQVYIETLNEQAPLKKKFLKANHVSYMTKSLSKAIMWRPQLESNHTLFFITNTFFNSVSVLLKGSQRQKVLLNITPALIKSLNMSIWVVGT